jgi:hypothetical protein
MCIRDSRRAVAATVPPRRFKHAARELGFDASAAARDLDVHQWAGLFAAVSRPELPDAGLLDEGGAVRPVR